MFLAIVFIVIGLFLLLNAFGIIIASNFWGLFWSIILLAIGFKMLMRKGKCPICGFGMWSDRMHQKKHGECCGHENECECEHHEMEDEKEEQK